MRIQTSLTSGRLLFCLLLAIVCLEFFLYPRVQVAGAYVRPVDVLILAAVAVVVFRGWREGSGALARRLAEDRALILLLSILAVAGLLSLTLSQVPSQSLKKLVQLLERLGLVIVTVWAVTKAHRVREVTRVVLIMVVFEALFAYVQYVLNLGEAHLRLSGSLVRASGTLENRLASYLLLGFLLAAADGASAASAAWRRSLAVAGVVLAALFLVQVRTVWVLTAVALVVVLIYLRSRTGAHRLAACLGVGVVAFLAVNIVRIGLAEYAPSQGPNVVGEYTAALSRRGLGTAEVRKELWMAALRMFQDQPVTGTGLGTYGLLYREDPYGTDRLRKLADDYRLGVEIDAHSTLITRLAEMGLIGSVCFAVFHLLLATWAWRIRSVVGHRDGTAVGVAVVILVSVLADVIIAPLGGNLFWIFVGLLWVLLKDRAHGNAIGSARA